MPIHNHSFHLKFGWFLINLIADLCNKIGFQLPKKKQCDTYSSKLL